MSSSGPTNIPGPNIPGSNPRSQEPNARLIGVPNELRDVRTPIKLAGRVAEVLRDGSVKIETPRGTVEIVLPKNQVPPEGTRVEIVVPPGRPPQQVTVRPAPEQSTQPAPQPPSQAQTPTTSAPARPAETPVDVRVTPQGQTPAQAAPPPPAQLPFDPAPPREAPLQPQDLIQLLPLAPRLEAEIFVPTPDVIAAPVIEKTAFAAQLSVIAAQDEILQQVIQTPQPAPLSTALPAAVPQTPIKNFIQPVAQAIADFFPALSAPLKNIPIQSLAPETAFAVPVTPGVLPAAVAAETIPALLTPALSTPTADKLQLPPPLTAQIISIAPPPVGLFAPGAKAPQTPLEVVKNLIENAPEKIAAAIKNTAQPQTVTAIVTGTIAQLPVVSFFTPQGEIIQNFVLQPAAPDLVPGTMLQITPLPAQPGTVPLPPGVPLPLSFLTPEPWPLMQQIYNVLLQAAPQAAQAFSNVTPNAANAAQMSPAALFFLAAVRAGDLTGWLGDKSVDALRRDPRGLLSRLTQEGGALSRLSAEPLSQDWRGMSIPLYWQGEIHKMALYYKRDGEGGNEKEKGGQSRFIFDLSLSNMGKVQLDGLMRGKKLDLIVRTEQAFAQATQMQMRRAYTNALEQSQLSGELSFQSRPDQWVVISKGKEAYSANI